MAPLFLIPLAGILGVFSFVAVNAWLQARLKERESYYETEMLKKIAETQGAGANPALEFLREKERIAAAKRTAGMKLGGLVSVALGIALLIVVGVMQVGLGARLVGLVPLLIGVAVLAYAILLAPKE